VSATTEFEGKGGDDLATSLSQLMERVLGQQSAFNSSQLCVIPGKVCWDLYIDVTILRNGGNMMDLIFFATRMALADTKIPRLAVEELIGEESDVAIAAADYDIEDTEQDMQPLVIDQVPILITFTKVCALIF
jgi:exosome complex component RRP42